MNKLKRIIPIAITIIVCIYLFFYAFFSLKSMNLTDPLGMKLLLFSIGGISFGVMCSMIIALFRRLKEIKEEEKDDISKY